MWLVTLLSALVVREDEELDAGDAASTLFRLFRSKHVRDLKIDLPYCVYCAHRLRRGRGVLGCLGAH